MIDRKALQVVSFATATTMKRHVTIKTIHMCDIRSIFALKSVNVCLYVRKTRWMLVVAFTLYFLPLLRAAIVNRTYGKHKSLYIYPFLPTIFGPINYMVPRNTSIRMYTWYWLVAFICNSSSVPLFSGSCHLLKFSPMNCEISV